MKLFLCFWNILKGFISGLSIGVTEIYVFEAKMFSNFVIVRNIDSNGNST